MTILIVDDSPSSQTLLRTFLRSTSNTKLVFCDSAQSVFDELRLGSFDKEAMPVDLILLDIILPDINGIEVCRRIREDSRYADVPIIMVTAITDDRYLEQAFAAGANDYITKPIHKITLLVRVKATLRLKAEIDCRKAREKELLQTMALLEQANETLYQLSAVDGLTGVANRWTYDTTLDKEWQRAQRENMPLSLIMIDIDCFKAYNDTYGHQAGDECLRNVATIAGSVLLRSTDFIARYGGEEFAVILPNIESQGAITVAENIRKAIANSNIQHRASFVADHVTVSLGIATTWPAQGLNRQQLVPAADEAMYQAKHQGRNQFVAVILGKEK